MTTPFAPTPVEHPTSPGINLRLFVFILLALVGGAIVRSAIATRLDGFTIDEAYHIAAGVSYVRNADFRINPEHPPLVKLWVGSLISATGFRLSSIRPFTDKEDERNFTEEDIYLNNDFNSVQRRARIAMWTLNGLLLVALAFAVRRTFGPGVALGTSVFLAIDPTVAAHLPVVMTDLPVSLVRHRCRPCRTGLPKRLGLERSRRVLHRPRTGSCDKTFRPYFSHLCGFDRHRSCARSARLAA